MDLSVIIPVFNAEATLTRCVESVSESICSLDAEIILVNDGSTDNSGRIAAGLAANNAQIKYYEKSNGGVSSARNHGLSQAQGEWICFVDDDDIVRANSLERFISHKSQISDADLVILKSYIGEKERYPWEHDFAPGTYYSPEDLLKKGYLRGSICGCIFSRRFLAEKVLLFPEGIKLGEDTTFFCACLTMARHICFSDIHFYQITPRPDSASRKKKPEDVFEFEKTILWVHNNTPDCAIRNYTLFKLIINLTSRAVDCCIPATNVEKKLDNILPLPTEGIYTERWKIKLLNANYSIFYKCIRLRNRYR